MIKYHNKYNHIGVVYIYDILVYNYSHFISFSFTFLLPLDTLYFFLSFIFVIASCAVFPNLFSVVETLVYLSLKKKKIMIQLSLELHERKNNWISIVWYQIVGTEKHWYSNHIQKSSP